MAYPAACNRCRLRFAWMGWRWGLTVLIWRNRRMEAGGQSGCICRCARLGGMIGWWCGRRMGWRFRLRLGRSRGRQPEIFGKPATDGVSAARRHFASQQSYGDLLFGDEPSPFHFGFQAAVGILQKLQPEMRGSGVQREMAWCADWLRNRQPETRIKRF